MLISHHTDCAFVFQMTSVDIYCETIAATDLDGDLLYYSLISESVGLISFVSQLVLHLLKSICCLSYPVKDEMIIYFHLLSGRVSMTCLTLQRLAAG